MIYNKNNLVIHQIADNHPVREEFSGVLFKKDRTIATDSYKLIEVINNQEQQNLITEAPIMSDKTASLKAMPKEGYLIPAKSVKKVLANLKEVKSNLPILQYCWFLNNNNNETVKIATTNLDRADIVNTKLLNGKYPDVNQVLQPLTDNNYKTTITLNLEHLKELVDVLSQMNIKDNQIEIKIKDKVSPLWVKTETVERQEVKALIMPIKT